MDLRSLDYFVAVANLLNFSKAAESRFVAQSTLSKTIADLESELGVQLLERKSRSVMLTPAGAEFLHEAQSILEHSARLEASAKEGRLGQNIVFHKPEMLTIGISGHVCENRRLRTAIAAAAHELMSDNSGVNVRFEEYQVDDIYKALRSGIFDVCFPAVNSIQSDSDLNYRVICEDRLVLVPHKSIAPPDESKGLSVFFRDKFVNLLENDTIGLPQIMKVLSSLNVTPNIKFSSSRHACTMSSEAGMGITIMPMSAYEALNSPYLYCVDDLGEDARLVYCAAWKKSNLNILIQMLFDKMDNYLI